MAVRILIIDTEPPLLRRLEKGLAEAGFEVLSAPDGMDPDADLEAHSADAILTARECAGRDSLERLASLGRRYPRPMIMLLEQADPELSLDAARAGVTAYALEELSPGSLRALVELATIHFRTYARLSSELSEMKRSLQRRKLI